MTEKELITDAIYEIVRMIPPGRATSYGAIARAIGCPDHSRMVGRIMGVCSGKDVPAHRVVDSRGRLSGSAAFGGDRMCRLLETEGVGVASGRIKNWKKIFWDPSQEIGL